jgi:hypothetical protein
MLPMLFRLRYLLFLSLFAVACATPSTHPTERQQRIDRAERELENDPVVQAHRAAVEAAQAKEESPKLVDGVELRVRDDYLENDHQIRTLARLDIVNPIELRAEREALSAATDIEVARLEEVSLERRVEFCFPSVEALVLEERISIYAKFAERQQNLLDWNSDLRESGVIDELGGARFELAGRTKLAVRQPPARVDRVRIPMQLPEIGQGGGELIRTTEQLREKIRAHHPSVTVRRATAKRYLRLAELARARRLPGLKFVDLSYEHRTERDRDGVAGQLAFSIPFGGEARAEIARLEALGRQNRSETIAVIDDQVSLGLRALNDVHDFESRSDEWRELEQLAMSAEQIVDRWWSGRLAKPSQVVSLLDDAYDARIAVLEARELAATAQCTLLAMTGVRLKAWPRE